MAAGSTFMCPTLRVVAAVREHPTHFGQRLVPAAWDDALESVRAAHAAGVAIVAGTDAGIFGVRIADLWRELSLIAQQTGSRWEGLRAATCVAAAAIGIPDLGSVRAGARADLVVLRSDPVAKETSADDVVAVMRDGRWLHGGSAAAVT